MHMMAKGMLVIEMRFERSKVLRRSLTPSSTVLSGLGINHIFVSL
jgi:hypothetical protein